jgi:hypothetical protein
VHESIPSPVLDPDLPTITFCDQIQRPGSIVIWNPGKRIVEPMTFK